MSVKTCDWPVDFPLRPCGKPAEWRVGISDGVDRLERDVCDEHLLDAQDDVDYVGARAL